MDELLAGFTVGQDGPRGGGLEDGGRAAGARLGLGYRQLRVGLAPLRVNQLSSIVRGGIPTVALTTSGSP